MMAKKGKAEQTRARNIEELNEILKNSFSAIKKDMDDVNEKLHLFQNSLAEAKKKMDDSRKDFVTVDKLNALKIKIADVKEDIKRLDRAEEQLKKINEKLVDRDKFEAEKQNINERLDELKNQADLTEKTSRSAVTEARLKQFAKEMSAEINRMTDRIELYGKKGGEIVDEIAEKLRKETDRKVKEQDDKVNAKQAGLKEDVKKIVESERKESGKRMAKLMEGLNKAREEQKSLVSRSQMSEILRDVNREFDSIKDDVEDLKTLNKEIKQIRKDKLSKAYFEQQAEELSSRMNDMEERLKELGNEVKENSKLNRDVKALDAKVAKLRGKPEGKRGFSILTAANVLIVLAFALLAASLALYFTGRNYYMNYLIAGAVVSFVAGMAVRIVSVIRE